MNRKELEMQKYFKGVIFVFGDMIFGNIAVKNIFTIMTDFWFYVKKGNYGEQDEFLCKWDIQD